MRIDTGVRQGDEITPFYDPMIAKLIVHGATRARPSRACARRWREYQIVGVRTNVEFLRRLMSAPSFVEARLDTALIERERDHLFAPRGEAAPRMWELAAQAFVAGAARGRRLSASVAITLGRPQRLGARRRGERRLKLREGERRTRSRGVDLAAGEAPGAFVGGNEIPSVQRRRAPRIRLDRSLSTGHRNTPTLTAGCSRPCRAGCWPCT